MKRVCVWPNGMAMPLETAVVLAEDGDMDMSQVANVVVRPNEHPADAAHRHLKAEANYWRTL